MKIDNKISEAKRINSRWLNLRGCDLTQMPEGIDSLHSVENLDIGNNQFRDLKFDFTKLPNLKRLELDNCGISKLPISLKDSKSLTSLNLSRNKIDQGSLRSLPDSLKSINLNQTSLDNIPKEILDHPKIREIQLSDNYVKSIEILIDNPKSIFILNLSNNKIGKFPIDCRKLKIERLHIHGNLLNQLPENIWEIDGLTSINLSKNNIEHLPSCQHSNKLHEINVSYNRIKKIDNSIFLNTELRKIDISYNQIEELPTALTSHEKLIELNISNNQIKVYPEKIIEKDIRKFSWKENQFQGVYSEFSDLDSYFRHKFDNLKNLPLKELNVDSRKLTEQILKKDYPLIERVGNVLKVVDLSFTKEFSVSEISAICTIYQKPAKGGGNLSVKIEFNAKKDEYIFSKYGNNPKRKYEASRFGFAISQLINVDFKLVDGGYDC